MKYCANCGQEMADDIRICPNCSYDDVNVVKSEELDSKTPSESEVLEEKAEETQEEPKTSFEDTTFDNNKKTSEKNSGFANKIKIALIAIGIVIVIIVGFLLWKNFLAPIPENEAKTLVEEYVNANFTSKGSISSSSSMRSLQNSNNLTLEDQNGIFYFIEGKFPYEQFSIKSTDMGYSTEYISGSITRDMKGNSIALFKVKYFLGSDLNENSENKNKADETNDVGGFSIESPVIFTFKKVNGSWEVDSTSISSFSDMILNLEINMNVFMQNIN